VLCELNNSFILWTLLWSFQDFTVNYSIVLGALIRSGLNFEMFRWTFSFYVTVCFCHEAECDLFVTLQWDGSFSTAAVCNQLTVSARTSGLLAKSYCSASNIQVLECCWTSTSCWTGVCLYIFWVFTYNIYTHRTVTKFITHGSTFTFVRYTEDNFPTPTAVICMGPHRLSSNPRIAYCWRRPTSLRCPALWYVSHPLSDSLTGLMIFCCLTMTQQCTSQLSW